MEVAKKSSWDLLANYFTNLNLFSASAGLVLQNAIENKGTKSTLFVLYGKKTCRVQMG
jgi:hypothetical protein